MLRKCFLSTAAVALLGTAAQAQMTAQSAISTLQGQGFQHIEVKVGPTQIEAEVRAGADKIEFVFDRATGAMLTREVYPGRASEVALGIEINQEPEDFITGDDLGVSDAALDAADRAADEAADLADREADAREEAQDRANDAAERAADEAADRADREADAREEARDRARDAAERSN